MARAPSKKRRNDLDDRIDAAWTTIKSERMRVRVPEHQRQRAVNPDSDDAITVSSGDPAVDSQMLGNLTEVNMSFWEMLSIYANAGTVYYLRLEDQIATYEIFYNYLKMWAERTNLYPDDEHPSMTDFILMDEYVESLHPEYELNCFITKKPTEKPTPRGIGSQMRQVFGRSAMMPAAKPTFAATRYESVIKLFSETVWSAPS